MADITRILEAVQQGDTKAAAELFTLVYAELHQLAGQKMARELPGHTLQPTELVHEAWLRLGGDRKKDWQNRAHFFGAAGLEPSGQNAHKHLISCSLGRSTETPKSQKTHICVRLRQKVVGKWEEESGI